MANSYLSKAKSEREKMLCGEEYDSRDAELYEMRRRTRAAIAKYNADPSPENMREIFGRHAENLTIIPPFQCEYGENIRFGKGVFVNFNFSALSGAAIEIGDNCYIGPNVGIYTAMHPVDPERRNMGINFARPVKIGANCWLGAGVTVLAGVEIGEGCTIGAGSVVTKSIPPRCVAYGNPCRVARGLNPAGKAEAAERFPALAGRA